MGKLPETKSCVACAESIKIGAVLCRFCKTRQDDPSYLIPQGQNLATVLGEEIEVSLTCTACGNPDAENFYCSLCGTELLSADPAKLKLMEEEIECFRCSSSSMQQGVCQNCGYHQAHDFSTNRKAKNDSSWGKLYDIDNQGASSSSGVSSRAAAIAWTGAALLVAFGLIALNSLPSETINSLQNQSSRDEQPQGASKATAQVDDAKACRLFSEGYELAMSENGSTYGMGLWRSKAAQAMEIASDRLAFELQRFVQNSGEPTDIVVNIAELCS